mgnify:CR=1 FL=1
MAPEHFRSRLIAHGTNARPASKARHRRSGRRFRHRFHLLGARVEPLQRNRFAGFLAETVRAVFQAPQRGVDLGDQLALTVAGAEFELPFGFRRCPVGQIGVTGYQPGRNFGVRVTNAGGGRYTLEHLVDGFPEGKITYVGRSAYLKTVGFNGLSETYGANVPLASFYRPSEHNDDAPAALKKVPRCMPAYLFLGQMAKIAGDLALAERHLKRGLQIFPDDPDLLRELRYLRK